MCPSCQQHQLNNSHQTNYDALMDSGQKYSWHVDGKAPWTMGERIIASVAGAIVVGLTAAGIISRANKRARNA